MENIDWRRNLRFRCTGCGKCCRETVVLVTDQDVVRLSDGTGMAAERIVRFFRPEELVMEPRHPFWVEFTTGRAVMGLRWDQGHCQFLGADNLCTVYASRPVTCREYPFNVVHSGDGKVRSVEIEHAVECPGEMDGRNRLRDVRAVVAWNEAQSAEYVAKVRTWNRRKEGRKTRPGFLSHLGLV